MMTRRQESTPRKILAIQSGLAILAVVIGASERIDVVRWAFYLGHLLLPIVIASWGLFLVNVILFLVAFCGRVCFPSTEATFLDDWYVMLRRFVIVVASLILAVIAFVGMTPAFM
jgi:hypothetical protein